MIATVYEVICRNGADPENIDSELAGTLSAAKAAVGRFTLLYPDAEFIFVRQHLRGTTKRFRVLHQLTVRRLR